MIIDRTCEFLKIRTVPKKLHQKIEITKDLRTKLSKAHTQYQTIKAELDRHCLPSFTNRKRKMAEIQRQKCDLNLNLLQIENMINHLSDVIKHMAVCRKMREYFLHRLKRILVDFRNTEEMFLKKVVRVRIFDEIDCGEQDRAGEVQDIMMMKRMNDAEKIKSTIYFLTTMLMDIKMVVTSQTAKIDRIEVHFNETEDNLRATNEELKKIPKRHNRIKNRIIYCLSLCVIIMIVLSIFKAAKKRNKL